MVPFVQFIAIAVITTRVAAYSQGNVFLPGPGPLAYFGPPRVPLYYQQKENSGVIAAKATVKAGSVNGTVSFYQTHSTSPVLIAGNLIGLESGRHGVYVTEFGNLEQSCDKSGPVWNTDFSVTYNYQGWLFDKPLGDLGSISATNESTTVDFLYSNNFISLTPGNPANILGRGLVIVTYSVQNNSTTTTVTGCGPIIAVPSTQINNKISKK